MLSIDVQSRVFKYAEAAFVTQSEGYLETSLELLGTDIETYMTRIRSGFSMRAAFDEVFISFPVSNNVPFAERRIVDFNDAELTTPTSRRM